MRKILFTLLALGALLTAIPAASLAHGADHHRGDRDRGREHRHARHDDRIQHERFGGRDDIRHDAGTVSSFADGRLTIRLNDGSTVTGAVDRATEIECEVPEFMRPADQGPGGSGSGPSGDPGDDNGHGGPENDPGDDNGQRQCAAVAPGMVVRDATLTLTGFGPVWTRVDLIDP
jgi:hypothetical protein